MKIRIRKIVNFVAFNLLFFALYLNFIHKDKPSEIEQGYIESTETQNKTVLVENNSSYPEQGSAKVTKSTKGETTNPVSEEKSIMKDNTAN